MRMMTTSSVSRTVTLILACNNTRFLVIYTFPVLPSTQSTPCRHRRGHQISMKVQVKATLQWAVWSAVLPGLLVGAIQVREPENESETPTAGPSVSNPEALTATETPDNGMAVGEAPEIEHTGTNISPELAIGSARTPAPSAAGSEFAVPPSTPSVDAAFPDNHQNFNGSPYLGSIETPPYLSAYNKYQQQYKEYYEQKNKYAHTAKPIKFEDDNTASHYIQPNGLSAYGDESSTQNDDRLKNKPFPYLYDGLQAVSHQQATYPIPENNILDPQSEEAEEQHELEKHVVSTVPSMFSSFSGLSNLFGGYKLPSSFHQPNSHLQDQRSQVSHKQKSNGSWKKVLKLLTTVVPFGLFLATLTPNLLYINSTEDNRPSRLRSLDNLDVAESRRDGMMPEIDPLVELVQRFGGLEAMENPQCEDRFFCEMSVLGEKESSNFIEKGFWYLAHETPDDVAKDVGMKELFQAIRNRSCEVYNCPPKVTLLRRTEMNRDGKKPSKSVAREVNKWEEKPKIFKKINGKKSEKLP